MKALTIHQPWASLIVDGLKNIENRTWKINFRGTILIHAAATRFSKEPIVGYSCLLKKGMTDNNIKQAVANDFNFINLPYAAIIGTVDIVDCVKDHSSPWAIKNHYHWVLENAVKFEQPILHVKGNLSLWDYPMTTIVK